MRALLKLFVVAIVFTSGVACAPGTGTSARSETGPSPTPTPTPSILPTSTPEPTDGRSRPERIADRMAATHAALMSLVDEWLAQADGRPRGARFHRLEILGLEKQMKMRMLVARPRLFEEVLKHLPPGLKLETKRNFKAARQLYALTPPVQRRKLRMPTSREDPPKLLLRAYAEGEERFGVPWSLLAAINLVESRMGRLNGPSSSGALGPMQFMPATWDAYGRGSPFDPHNAIIAAARYLAASGAPERLRDAVWNYNHSDYYVNAVITYHRHMAAHPKAYYSYYFWQAFARTTRGDLQLTGPGNTYPY